MEKEGVAVSEQLEKDKRSGARAASGMPAGEARAWQARELTEGIRRGDEHAFDSFYDLYVDRLYRYLLVVAPWDEDLVREALQDTMFRVIRYIKPFESERVLWGWLTRVARSSLFDLLRRRKSAARLEKDLFSERIIPLHPRESDADELLLAALRRVLSELPEEERELLDAHYLQGIRQSALAKRQGKTRKAIESRLARLRRKVRAMILEALDDE